MDNCYYDTRIEDYEWKRAKRLKTDLDFYNKCVTDARTNYNKYYSEEVFLQHMNKVLS